MESYLAEPKPAPPLNIPNASSSVTVRVIDSTTTLAIDPGLFWEPSVKGLDSVDSPIYCFLVSNGNRHVVFDLAVRKDWENLAPKTVSLIKATTKVDMDMDIAEILDSDESGVNVKSKDIEAVIWSHHHFDHTGDPCRFPPSTELVVGPGFRENYLPGYPTNPEASILDSDVEGRSLRELDFYRDGHGMKIGRFDAIDYFGDGSFYLLNAPGHAIGHICGLARVTTSPDTFVFMGADSCHHPAVLRPTEYLPLPKTINPSPIARFASVGCPGELLQRIQPRKSATEPFFQLARTPLFPQYDDAVDTVHKIEELDADENIFVIIAHDDSIKDKIALFPNAINDWKAKEIASKTRWLFCSDFEGALEDANAPIEASL